MSCVSIRIRDGIVLPDLKTYDIRVVMLEKSQKRAVLELNIP